MNALVTQKDGRDSYPDCRVPWQERTSFSRRAADNDPRRSRAIPSHRTGDHGPNAAPRCLRRPQRPYVDRVPHVDRVSHNGSNMAISHCARSGAIRSDSDLARRVLKVRGCTCSMRHVVKLAIPSSTPPYRAKSYAAPSRAEAWIRIGRFAYTSSEKPHGASDVIDGRHPCGSRQPQGLRPGTRATANAVRARLRPPERRKRCAASSRHCSRGLD
jgi:hypothetical protein